MGDGTADQGLGIGPDGAPVQTADDFFVAGQLDIPAQEAVAQPHEGIEPVDRQQSETQGLPQVVQPPQVGVFVGQHIFTGYGVQVRGKIDAGTEQPQNEGGFQSVALPHPPADPGSEAHPQPQGQIAVEGIDAHGTHARQPQDRPHQAPMLDPVHGGLDLDAQGGIVDGIGNDVQGGGLGEFRRLGLHHQIVVGHHLPAGDQAHGAFDGHGTQQPDGHQRPQGTVEGLRRFFQCQPGGDHCQHQPACGDAEIENIGEGHGHTPFSYSSSMLRISSRSARLSSPRLVKAAMKAGRLPPQLSSRNRRL